MSGKIECNNNNSALLLSYLSVLYKTIGDVLVDEKSLYLDDFFYYLILIKFSKYFV